MNKALLERFSKSFSNSKPHLRPYLPAGHTEVVPSVEMRFPRQVFPGAFRKRVLRTAISSLFVWAAVVSGADLDAIRKEPLPNGPLIKPLPNPAHWQVHISYSSRTAEPDPAAPAPANASDAAATLPRSLSVKRFGAWTCAQAVTGDGQKTEAWFQNRTPYLLLADNSPVVLSVSDRDDETPILPLFNIDSQHFPDTEWVSAKTYLGIQSLSSKECLVFRQTDDAASAVVWVDLETRYPIQWKRESETRVFKILTPPDHPLNPPDPIEKTSKVLNRIQQAASYSPPGR